MRSETIDYMAAVGVETLAEFPPALDPVIDEALRDPGVLDVMLSDERLTSNIGFAQMVLGTLGDEYPMLLGATLESDEVLDAMAAEAPEMINTVLDMLDAEMDGVLRTLEAEEELGDEDTEEEELELLDLVNKLAPVLVGEQDTLATIDPEIKDLLEEFLGPIEGDVLGWWSDKYAAKAGGVAKAAIVTAGSYVKKAAVVTATAIKKYAISPVVRKIMAEDIQEAMPSKPEERPPKPEPIEGGEWEWNEAEGVWDFKEEPIPEIPEIPEYPPEIPEIPEYPPEIPEIPEPEPLPLPSEDELPKTPDEAPDDVILPWPEGMTPEEYEDSYAEYGLPLPSEDELPKTPDEAPDDVILPWEEGMTEEEYKASYEEGLPIPEEMPPVPPYMVLFPALPGMPAPPLIPALPGMEKVPPPPGVKIVDSVGTVITEGPGLPELPGIPGIQGAGIEGLPKIPGMPGSPV